MELYHHGVKGMHWGVRRYQNPDGSLTPTGRRRLKAGKRVAEADKTRADVDKIVDSLSDDEKRMMNSTDGYLTMQQGEHVVKRFIEKHGNEPVAFFDIMSDGWEPNGKEAVTVSLAVKKEEQGKGYGYRVAKKGNDWLMKNRDKFSTIEWETFVENTRSQELAKKLGYKHDKKASKNRYDGDNKIEVYSRR